MVERVQVSQAPSERQHVPSAAPASRTVSLRNDSPALRTVVNVQGERVNISPSKVALDVDLPQAIIKMLEKDHYNKMRQGRHNILKIIDRDVALRALQGEKPAYEVSPPQEAMLDLASRAGTLGTGELQDRAKELLGPDRFPSGTVTPELIVQALQLHGRGGPLGG